MSENHKQEIESLKRQHQADIAQTIDKMKAKYDDSERMLRDSFAGEREKAIEIERKAIRERYEKQLDDERISSEQHRARMMHDFEVEKDNFLREIREKEHFYERKKDILLNEKKEALREMKDSYQEKLSHQESNFQSEISKVKEQYEVDFKIWRQEFEKKMKIRESERENIVREQYRLERDKQIDDIVAKFDADSLKGQHEFEAKLK
jgi:5-azacytidine-induced protein 1